MSASISLNHLSFRLPGRPLVFLLWSATCGVLALGLFREWYIYTYGTETIFEDLRQIALDTEHCLGAWYSSLLMVFSALLMAIISMSPSPDVKAWRYHWRFLAIIFIGLSIDETVSFHEVLIDPLRETFGFSGLLYFAWIVPAAMLCLVVGLAYLRFVLALEARLKVRIIFAGGLYLLGALGLEAVGGHCYTTYGPNSLCYFAAATTEETLEMLGLTVLLGALFDHLRRHYDAISVHLASPIRLEATRSSESLRQG